MPNGLAIIHASFKIMTGKEGHSFQLAKVSADPFLSEVLGHHQLKRQPKQKAERKTAGYIFLKRNYPSPMQH